MELDLEDQIEEAVKKIKGSFFEHGRLYIYKFTGKMIDDPTMEEFIEDFARARIVEDMEIETHARAIAMAFESEE